jgi:hypothetical protein
MNAGRTVPAAATRTVLALRDLDGTRRDLGVGAEGVAEEDLAAGLELRVGEPARLPRQRERGRVDGLLHLRAGQRGAAVIDRRAHEPHDGQKRQAEDHGRRAAAVLLETPDPHHACLAACDVRTI